MAVALASKQSVEAQMSSVLPAQKASAEAALAQAQVELDKMTIYAGVDGTLEQFTLRKGDVVNTMLRSAGVLIPTGAGREVLTAGLARSRPRSSRSGMVGRPPASRSR